MVASDDRPPELPAEMRYVLGDQHYTDPPIHTACAQAGPTGVAARRGACPHTDAGLGVRWVLHELRLGAIENLNDRCASSPCPAGIFARYKSCFRTFAQKSPDSPFSQFIEQECRAWSPFTRALRKADQAAFDQPFDCAKLHVQAGVYLSRPSPFEVIAMAMLLEQQTLLERLLAQLGWAEVKLSGGTEDPRPWRPA